MAADLLRWEEVLQVGNSIVRGLVLESCELLLLGRICEFEKKSQAHRLLAIP